MHLRHSRAATAAAAAAAAAAARRVLSSAATACTSPTTPTTPPEQLHLKVGQIFSLRRAFTADDVASFARLSEDANPIHLDAAAARAAGFPGPVVHGMLCASLFSGIIGTRQGSCPLPGSPHFSALACVGNEWVRLEDA
jgi:hypothetical protein